MSLLSDERFNCASRAAIESQNNSLKAHSLAERYYRVYVGRELSLGEVQDLASLVDKKLNELKVREPKKSPNQYRQIKGK